VRGLAQVRLAPDQPWKAAMVGQTLTENAEIRTGPRSSIQLQVPPDQVIRFDQLGTITLSRLMSAARQGSQRPTPTYSIEEGDVQHSTTIRTPNATISIRG
jgi:hypothetical protein